MTSSTPQPNPASVSAFAKTNAGQDDDHNNDPGSWFCHCGHELAADSPPEAIVLWAEHVATEQASAVAAERRRQVDAGGFTPEHHGEHGGRLLAAAVPSFEHHTFLPDTIPTPWPSSDTAWKPRDHILAAVEMLHRPVRVYKTPVDGAAVLAHQIEAGTAVSVLTVCAGCTPEGAIKDIGDGILDEKDLDAIEAQWPCSIVTALPTAAPYAGQGEVPPSDDRGALQPSSDHANPQTANRTADAVVAAGLAWIFIHRA